jgi:hypothetical protein
MKMAPSAPDADVMNTHTTPSEVADVSCAHIRPAVPNVLVHRHDNRCVRRPGVHVCGAHDLQGINGIEPHKPRLE